MLFVIVVVLGGTPSSGKSCVAKMLLAPRHQRAGYVKVDCAKTPDLDHLAARGLPCTRIVADRFCPDYAWLEAAPSLLRWAEELGLDLLVVETAGLCARCAPYLQDAAAVCILDATCGVLAPEKLGPHLADADVCVITKGDLISQAEREILEAKVKARNPKAAVAWFNGLTGEGSEQVLRNIEVVARSVSSGQQGPAMVRTPLPQLYCSYCLGRLEVGISLL